MATPKTSTPGGLQLKLQSALTGVQNVLAKGSAFKISGNSLNQAQLITTLQGFLSPFTDVTDTKQAYAQAVLSRKGEQSAAKEFLQQLKAALVALYGRNSPTLAQFGMSAKTPAKQTGETSVLAAAKRALTRKMRGTLGSVQKAGIKAIGTPQVTVGENGQIISSAPTPVAPPAAPSQPTSTNPGSGTPAPVAAPVTPSGTVVPTAPAPVAPAPAASPAEAPTITIVKPLTQS